MFTDDMAILSTSKNQSIVTYKSQLTTSLLWRNVGKFKKMVMNQYMLTICYVKPKTNYTESNSNPTKKIQRNTLECTLTLVKTGNIMSAKKIKKNLKKNVKALLILTLSEL